MSRRILVLILSAIAIPATAQTFGFSVRAPAACLPVGNAMYRLAAPGTQAEYTVRIDPAAKFFVGFEIFAGGDHDRVFDRVDHDLRVDSFFPADLIDCLKKQIRHRYSPLRRAFSSAQSNCNRDS